VDVVVSPTGVLRAGWGSGSSPGSALRFSCVLDLEAMAEPVVGGTRSSSTWERYAWVAGILFVVAVVVETAISIGIPINQNDSAAKIANNLAAHRTRLLVVEGVCVVYAAMFPIYLWKFYDLLLRKDADGSRALGSLLMVGGVLFVALHAVSDVGIYGVLGGKLASFGAQHDQGVSYTLYLMTYALDSVADVFGSVFAFAAGVLVFRSGVLPRWLAWVSILVAILLFIQAFGLGGVVASFGLVLDLLGFVLLLLFVLVSSVILLRRENALAGRSG
jgi:hypothetical protein